MEERVLGLQKGAVDYLIDTVKMPESSSPRQCHGARLRGVQAGQLAWDDVMPDDKAMRTRVDWQELRCQKHHSNGYAYGYSSWV